MMRARAMVLAGLLCVSVEPEGVFAGQEAEEAIAAVDSTHGAISGIVTDAVTGLPLAGMQVSVARTDWDIATFTTGANGAYRFDGLTPLPSTYRVCVFDYSSRVYAPQAWYRRNLHAIASQCYDGDGDAVPVVAGQTTTGIDFPMLLKGRLSGRLTDAATGLPIAGGRVWYLHWWDPSPTSVTSDANGFFVTGRMSMGDAWVYATPGGYRPEAYGDVSLPCGNARCGSAISVVPGQTITGIDFALERGATVEGRVVDAATGAPLTGTKVSLLDTSGLTRFTVSTDATGRYRLPAAETPSGTSGWFSNWIPTGTYYVKTSESARHTDELYDDVPCPRTCDISGGTPLSLVEGQTTSGIDFALTLNGGIRGRVIDAATGAPLQYAWVEVGPAACFASTDADGFYSVRPDSVNGCHGLPTGSYFATAGKNGSAGMADYAKQLYSGILCEPDCTRSSGTPIQVVAGQVTEGVNFALTEKGRIEGRVTIAGTGAPVRGVNVTAEGSTSRGTRTDVDGRYSLRGLAEGSYKVWAFGATVLAEVFDDVPCAAPPCSGISGTPVVATLGQVTTGIDFELVEKGRIEGLVADAETGVPIPDAQVILYDSTGARITSHYARTGTDGTYALSAAPSAGTYFARAWTVTHRDEMYDNLPCSPTCEITSATPLPLAPGVTINGVDFSLARLDSQFHSVTPCRLLDTRSTGQPIHDFERNGQSYWVGVSGKCGIPASARAVALNVTVTGATANGHLTAFPDLPPTTSILNFVAGQTRANSAVGALNPDGYLRLRAALPSDDPFSTPFAHVILDVSGYFE